MHYFTDGQFRCPVVWSVRFSLHPRLQSSNTMNLPGYQALNSILEPFSVLNRRNMYVVKEEDGSVFYLR